MSDFTEVKGDNLPGERAELLSERHDECYTFNQVNTPESIHASLTLHVATGITPKFYMIDKATFERLMLVLNEHKPVNKEESLFSSEQVRNGISIKRSE